MPNYNFSTLNDKDFEELVRDLLSLELKVQFQNFKAGADQGIDLRYSSSSNRNSIVVQAKHYLKSGVRGLYRSLKKEKEKISKLKCKKYIIATSINLSAKNKDEIVDFLSPYLSSANDIYGNEDLNRILQTFEDVEKTHFKLWLTSTNILQKIHNNAIVGRSEFLKEKIKKNIDVYVQSSALNIALKILKKHKFILITGQPGVGKTTLAYVLVYSLLAKDFSLVYVDKNIRDAEDLLLSSTTPQVFYFDDFLGANYFEITNPKSSDTGLVNFIERIQNAKNKYLILTTRTTILNTAKLLFEKINQSNIEIARKELELKDYNEYDKARILYNNLYFNGLDEKYRLQVFKNRNYWKIIRHKNYNPRLIAFIADKRKFLESGQESYIGYVFNSLDNPHELWRHSYENQIEQVDRLFLTTLFSLGNSIDEEVLEKAFDKRLEYEINVNGFEKPNNAFNSILKRLLDGYITRTVHNDHVWISFLNPSISDFFMNYLKNSKSERRRLIESTCYLEQIEKIFESVLKDFNNPAFISETEFIIHLLSTREYEVHDFFARLNYKNYFDSQKMFIYSMLTVFDDTKEKTDLLIADLLNKVDFKQIDFYIYINIFKHVFSNRKIGGLVEQFVLANWDVIIAGLTKCVLFSDDGESLVEIFGGFSIDYQEYLKTDKGRAIKLHVDKLADNAAQELVDDSKDQLTSEEDIDKLKMEVTEKREEIYSAFLLTDRAYKESSYFYNIDESLLLENKKTKRQKKAIIAEPKKLKESFSATDIDDLFDITRLKH